MKKDSLGSRQGKSSLGAAGPGSPEAEAGVLGLQPVLPVSGVENRPDAKWQMRDAWNDLQSIAAPTLREGGS